MFPGLTTKLSESTVASANDITVDSDIVKLTGNTDIETILPKFGGFSGFLVLVSKDGAMNLLNSGNIAIAVTLAQNKACLLVFSKEDDKWYPGAIS